MKTSVEKLSENQVKVTIELDANEFKGAIKQAFNKVIKDVKIDGFRQGKVPFNIYVTRYGYESLYDEAINFAINDYYPQAIIENKVEIVSSPNIDFDPAALKHDGPFTFTATVDVLPPVHLGEYFNTPVKALSKEVTEADIESAINNTLKQKAENVIKEDAIASGDTAVIDFEGFIDDVAFEGGKGENYPLEIGSNSFIPGFEEQLIGLKSDDKKDVIVTFPSEYQAEALAGKEAKFEVLVHEVKTKVIPELTDEIVLDLKIDEITSVEQYTEYLKVKLQEEKDQQYENHIVEEVIKKACENAKVEIPSSMIAQELDRRMKEVEAQAAQYNLPLEVFLQYNGYEMDKFKIELEKTCEKRIFEQLVLDEIAKKEKIEVSTEDTEAELVKIAEANKTDVDAVKKVVEPEQLTEHIRAQKTIKLLKEKAIIE